MTLPNLRRLSRDLIHRVAVGASALLVVGLYYDGWWHGMFGRHSFWIPPHLVVYLGAVVMGVAFAARWWRDREEGRPLPPGYRVLGMALALTMLTAPADELWHRTFGVEAPTSVLSIWSPPHMAGLLSAIAAGLGVLGTMVREGGAGRLYGWMVAQAASVIGFATFAIVPLEPTGFHRVGGVAGPLPITLVLVGLRLMTLSLLRRPGTMTAIACVITPLIIFVTRAPGPGGPGNPPSMPLWLLALPAFAGAVLLDLLAWRRPEGSGDAETLARWGVLYAGLFTSLWYPAANAALRSGWSALEIVMIIVGSALMGYPAGRAAWWGARRLAGRPTVRGATAATVSAGMAR